MNRLECFGRTEELEALEGVCGSRRTAMVIVYGRRRVGKTALIQKVCEERGIRTFSLTPIKSKT